MKLLHRLPRIALAVAVAGVTALALLNLPSGTPWPMAFLIIAGFAAIYGFLDYFLPYLVAALRLGKLRSSSRFGSVEANLLGDLAHLHSDSPNKKKWALAFLPYPELVVRLTVRSHTALTLTPEAAEWFGPDSYELFSALIREYKCTPRSALAAAYRLMAAGSKDYTTFYGHCESASVEAALLAVEHDLPIEYARELAAE